MGGRGGGERGEVGGGKGRAEKGREESERRKERIVALEASSTAKPKSTAKSRAKKAS